ncbi:hypothetical protein U5A82_06020 [Sphingobium sp. CR2-8]|uniref:hypothetical protein n=1 Tax=Sphingobium sp. CR2-8 TaxID=1306534 RepID=UPI002DBFE9F2|nr:hypothetical protein [Sphingobium sp. CR2-8]MEC3910046.1 hypothetical protein [Sphingobium sp. CR2-8]
MNTDFDALIRRRRDPEEQAIAVAYWHDIPLDDAKELIEDYQRISLPDEGQALIARARGAVIRPIAERLLMVIEELRGMHISTDTLAAILDINTAGDAVMIDTAYKTVVTKAAAPLVSETVDPRHKLITCI